MSVQEVRGSLHRDRMRGQEGLYSGPKRPEMSCVATSGFADVVITPSQFLSTLLQKNTPPKKTKKVKPYINVFKRQGHVEEEKRPTVVPSLMLVAYRRH